MITFELVSFRSLFISDWAFWTTFCLLGKFLDALSNKHFKTVLLITETSFIEKMVHGKRQQKTGHPQKTSSLQQGETNPQRQDDLLSQADSRRVHMCNFCKHDFVGDGALIECDCCDACVCVPFANFSPSEYGILQRSTRLQ